MVHDYVQEGDTTEQAIEKTKVEAIAELERMTKEQRASTGRKRLDEEFQSEVDGVLWERNAWRARIRISKRNPQTGKEYCLFRSSGNY